MDLQANDAHNIPSVCAQTTFSISNGRTMNWVERARGVPPPMIHAQRVWGLCLSLSHSLTHSLTLCPPPPLPLSCSSRPAHGNKGTHQLTKPLGFRCHKTRHNLKQTISTCPYAWLQLNGSQVVGKALSGANMQSWRAGDTLDKFIPSPHRPSDTTSNYAICV